MATEEPRTVIVERSGGNGMTAIIALLVIALIAVGAYFLISRENNKDNAVSSAAQQVGDAAQDVGDAAQDAAK